MGKKGRRGVTAPPPCHPSLFFLPRLHTTPATALLYTALYTVLEHFFPISWTGTSPIYVPTSPSGLGQNMTPNPQPEPYSWLYICVYVHRYCYTHRRAHRSWPGYRVWPPLSVPAQPARYRLTDIYVRCAYVFKMYIRIYLCTRVLAHMYLYNIYLNGLESACSLVSQNYTLIARRSMSNARSSWKTTLTQRFSKTGICQIRGGKNNQWYCNPSTASTPRRLH